MTKENFILALRLLSNGFSRHLLTLLVLWMVYQSIFAQLPAVSFNHLRRDEDLHSDYFFSLFEDPRGFIWFGSLSGGGLYRFDGYDIRSFTTDPDNLKSSLSFDKVYEIYPVNDTLLYIGTYFGYSKLNPLTGKIRSYKNEHDDAEDVQQNVFYQFLEDSLHHTLWVGTGIGLGRIDHHQGRFQWTNAIRKDGSSPPPMKIIALLKDPLHDNKLFLGGPAGLYRYDIGTNLIEDFDIPGLKDSVVYVSGLALDDHKNLWIGLHSTTKFLRYNIARDEWTRFTIPRAKSNPGLRIATSKIIPQDDGKVWLAAFSHIGLLDPETGHFDGWEYNPDYPSGLLPNDHYNDLLTDRHGRLWVTSWSGIQYSDQTFMNPSGHVRDLQVAITSLDVRPIISETQKPLIYSGKLELDRQQRDVTFYYVLPNPLNPKNVNYQYRLEGYDKEWITTDQRIVRYAKLGGGEYQFQIKAQDGNNGPWTPVTSLTIAIPKMITEMVWFWIVLGVSLTGFGSAAFNFFIRRSREQAIMKSEFERQLSEIQMQALRAQMNPHFLFNSLNSIKYFAISKPKEETANYVSKFALLVRTILTNSKSKTISLQDELDALNLYIEIEHLRLEGTFDYKIEIDSNIHIRKVQVPPMILQPFVENAIWHGFMEKEEGGMLRIYVQDVGKQIQCRIEDNGIGRSRASELRKNQTGQRKSEGMQITADRIALINRIYHIHTEVDVIDLYHPDGSPAGTRVVIHIPIIMEEKI